MGKLRVDRSMDDVDVLFSLKNERITQLIESNL